MGELKVPLGYETGPRKPCLAVILCSVLEDEVNALAFGMGHIRRIWQLPQGLHNTPDKLREALQQAVEVIETTQPEVEAIAFVYGLCSRGSEGVTAKRCKIVMARAHDCITLLVGSKERYAEYVAAHPGTYWYSPGWNKHHTPPGPERYNKLLKQYEEKFGKDDAEYLMQTEQHWFSTYDRATFVDLGYGPVENAAVYTKECADWLKWKFDRVKGDAGLLRDLLDGNWDDERFVVLEPGEGFKMTADMGVIDRVKLTVSAQPATV